MKKDSSRSDQPNRSYYDFTVKHLETLGRVTIKLQDGDSHKIVGLRNFLNFRTPFVIRFTNVVCSFRAFWRRFCARTRWRKERDPARVRARRSKIQRSNAQDQSLTYFHSSYFRDYASWSILRHKSVQLNIIDRLHTKRCIFSHFFHGTTLTSAAMFFLRETQDLGRWCVSRAAQRRPVPMVRLFRADQRRKCPKERRIKRNVSLKYFSSYSWQSENQVKSFYQSCLPLALW